MGSITFNRQHFSFDDVRIRGEELLTANDQSFRYSFVLAKQWLNEQQAFTFHTSGSTGIPKEISLKREQLEASAFGTIEALGLTPDEQVFVCMNTQFIGGAMLLIRGLILNAAITLQEPTGNPLQQLETGHPFTFASFTPVQLFPLLRNASGEKEKLNRFKHILVGGAPIDPMLENELKSLDADVYHTYGMTETVSHIALRKIGGDGSYTTLEGVEIKTDERDCLAIRSTSTLHEWIYTNDVARLLGSHSFELLGRADDVVNSGGIKIWPLKIEQKIREILTGKISNVAVMGIPDSRLGQQLIAILETPDWTSSMKTRLEKELRSNLGKYEIPKHFYALPCFAYTPTGKINKAETLKMIKL